MNCVQESKVLKLKTLNPRIELFSPFNKPFTDVKSETQEDGISKFEIISPKVIEYMIDDNTKIVAKCTPCQCCACR